MKSDEKRAQNKRGPKENRLVLPVNWKAAIGTALKKKRPPEGWPKVQKPRQNAKKGP